MRPLPMGRYWGLRRLADDGGRFMLLDLRAATGDALAELIRGLAPFATGVLLEPTAVDVWRRWGSPHVGRIDAIAAEAEIEGTPRTAADAVLAPIERQPVTERLGIARMGTDSAADLGLDRATGLRVATCHGPDASLAGDVTGYLTATSFIAPALAIADTHQRRLIVADDLAPKLQALNAQVVDLPQAGWLDG